MLLSGMGGAFVEDAGDNWWMVEGSGPVALLGTDL